MSWARLGEGRRESFSGGLHFFGLVRIDCFLFSLNDIKTCGTLRVETGSTPGRVLDAQDLNTSLGSFPYTTGIPEPLTQLPS
jgi:hypothetical protein